MTIDAVIFDKDGTLFDFQASWSAFALRAVEAFPPAAPEVVARAIGFDLERNRFRPDAAFVSQTAAETAADVARATGGDPRAVGERLDALARATPQVPVRGLNGALQALGHLPLGIATNDAERSARAHLEAAGVAERFVFVAGFDSGHGGKPAPGQLLAFAEATGIAPGRIAMVGDSLHDLHAAEAAGMVGVGVLTGTADASRLRGHARTVLDDITHLPGWLSEL